MKRILFTLLLFTSAILQAQVEKPVHWKFNLEPISGDEYNLVFSADIDAPWHMYANEIPEGGPIATTFNYTDQKGFKLAGKLKELSKKEVKFDPTFKMDIGMFAEKAVFKQKIEVTSSKPFDIKGYVEFMVCNDRTCLAPEEVEFSFQVPAAKKSESSPIIKKDSLIASSGASKDSISEVETAVKQTVSTSSAELANSDSKTQKSLWGFFFYNLFIGFGGLLTPCVYPMIPMTVSFFMRGQEKRRKSIMNALFFGFSIILIYTSLGLIVTLTGAGSNVYNTISTHWITNTIFFLLFMTFAASFLGLFEIVLPSKFTNKIDQQADKGGILAPFFMALTLVLVSFSCTGPIVSSLLIDASKGALIMPTLGMFAFSLAFALPFTIFAIFPGLMKNLPKSGGWLNSVKVFFAFILMALGLKYLSDINNNYHLNLFTREVFIGIWIVLFTLLGFYLLGKIKFAHDSEVKHIGVLRLLFVIVVFSFVLYLIPGLFGAPLTTISGWLPPKSKQAFDLSQLNTSSGSGSSSICGPAKYSDFLDIPYGIEGYFDYEEALACAKQQNKPLLIDFNGHSCTNCKLMENKVWPDKRVLEALKTKFVIVSLYIDDRAKLNEEEQFKTPDGKLINTIGKKNSHFQVTRFNSNSQPFYVIMDHNDNILTNPLGLTLNADEFLKFLDEGERKFNSK